VRAIPVLAKRADRANVLLLVFIVLGAVAGVFAHGWMGALIGAALGAAGARLLAALMGPDDADSE